MHTRNTLLTLLLDASQLVLLNSAVRAMSNHESDVGPSLFVGERTSTAFFKAKHALDRATAPSEFRCRFGNMSISMVCSRPGVDRDAAEVALSNTSAK